MPVAGKCVTLLLLLLAHISCGALTDHDLSHTPQYASEIGSHYRTKAKLYALILYRQVGKKELGKVFVSPFEDPTAPEVAFRRPIPVGQRIRVTGVRKRAMPFGNGLEFIVAIDGLDVPPGLEVVVPLYGELQSNDGFPSQKYFEKVP